MKTYHFVIILILSVIGGIAAYFIASQFIGSPTGYGGSAGSLEVFFILGLNCSAIMFGFGITGLLTMKIIKKCLKQ